MISVLPSFNTSGNTMIIYQLTWLHFKTYSFQLPVGLSMEFQKPSFQWWQILFRTVLPSFVIITRYSNFEKTRFIYFIYKTEVVWKKLAKLFYGIRYIYILCAPWGYVHPQLRSAVWMCIFTDMQRNHWKKLLYSETQTAKKYTTRNISCG
jgi:hypothetical protein